MNISTLNGAYAAARQAGNTCGPAAANWNQIPHKGMTTLSPEEIEAQVQQLGAAFVEAGSETAKQKIMDQFSYYQTLYTSHVSPDRKALYAEAVKTINKYAQNNNNSNKDLETSKNIFDYIGERDDAAKKNGKSQGMRFDTPYAMEGGGTVTATYMTGGTPTFDIKVNGQNILTINSSTIAENGLSYWATPAEQLMTVEIANVWQNAVHCAKAGYTPEGNRLNVRA